MIIYLCQQLWQTKQLKLISLKNKLANELNSLRTHALKYMYFG